MDCSPATPDEKAILFGEMFRSINVLSFEVVEGVQIMKIILNGEVISLIGDPERALMVMLGGNDGRQEPN